MLRLSLVLTRGFASNRSVRGELTPHQLTKIGRALALDLGDLEPDFGDPHETNRIQYHLHLHLLLKSIISASTILGTFT